MTRNRVGKSIVGSAQLSSSELRVTNWRVVWTWYGVIASIAAIFCWLLYRGVRYHDEEVYLQLATSVLSGAFEIDGVPTAYRPPAWPILLAISSGVGPEWVNLTVPFLLLIASGACAAVIGARVAGTWGALAAMTAVMLFPTNIYTATTLYPQTLAMALVLFCWMIIASWDENVESFSRPFIGLLLGSAAALLALAVPTLAPTALALLLLGVVTRWADREFYTILYAVVGFILPIAVWATRNMYVFNKFVPLSTSSGINLLYGNHPNAGPNTGVAVDISVERTQAAVENLDEIQRNEFFGSRAEEWIKSNPAEAGKLYLGKVFNYFVPVSDPVTSGESPSQILLIVMSGIFVILAVLVAARIFMLKKLSMLRSEIVMIALFFANAPFMAIFFTRSRFRQPLDSILLVEAAVGLVLSIYVISRTARSKSKL